MKPGGAAAGRPPAGGTGGSGVRVKVAPAVTLTIDPAPDGAWDWAVFYGCAEVWRDSAPTQERALEAAVRVARVVAIKP